MRKHIARSVMLLVLSFFICNLGGCKDPQSENEIAKKGSTATESNKGKEPNTIETKSSLSSQLPTNKGNNEGNSVPKSSAEKSNGLDAQGVAAKVAEGSKMLDAKNVDGAWKIAQELMIARPEDHAVIYFTARVLGEKKEFKKAIAMIGKIPEKDPVAGAASIGQSAQWLAELGDLSSAEVKLQTLLKEYPNAIPAIRLLSRIYNAQGRRWENSRVLERLVRLGDFTVQELSMAVDFREPYDDESLRKATMQFAPNDPYSHLGEIRNRIFKNRWEEQLPILEKLMAEHPDRLEIWIWYGSCLLGTDRFDQIAIWLNSPNRNAKKHPEYWYILGSFMLEQKEFRSAGRAFIEAIELDRRHVPAYQGLADCLLAISEPELATRTREYANDLVRINDLTQQILMKYASDQTYDEISNLYGRLGDIVGEFGWKASAAVVKKEPISDSIKSMQKEVRSGLTKPIAALVGIDKSQWPLPDMAKIESSHDTKESSPLDAKVQIAMEDVAKKVKLESMYINGAKPNQGWYTVEGLGGGVSVVDFDRDGWPDLYFSQAGDTPLNPTPNYQPKQLYRSMEGKEFRDVARAAHVDEKGFGQGTGVADIDQDGFSDLLVANVGYVSIYRNQGDGTFESLPYPQAESGSLWNSCIFAADLNGDHLPDILQGLYTFGEESITRWCSNEQNNRGNSRGSCHPKSFPPGKNRILYNNGDGTFTEVAGPLVDSIRKGYTLGTLITNLDRKPGNEVFFANDVSPNHYLLAVVKENNAIEMVECAASRGVSVDSVGRAQACMGIACGDQNRDGILDFIVTNFRNEVSTLYLQGADGIFSDGTRRSRLGTPTLPWVSFGCQLIDLDQDGWLDFASVNGHIDDYRHENTPWHMPSQILQNERGQFKWLQSPTPGAYFDGEWIGRGLQSLDFNRDGKMDLVATHLDRPVALLENRTQTLYHNLQMEFIGTRSERDAFGTIVEIKAGSDSWVATLAAGEGFYGSNEKLVSIGLGDHSRVDSIKVCWPEGSVETYNNIDADHVITIIEGQGTSGL